MGIEALSNAAPLSASFNLPGGAARRPAPVPHRQQQNAAVAMARAPPPRPAFHQSVVESIKTGEPVVQIANKIVQYRMAVMVVWVVCGLLAAFVSYSCTGAGPAGSTALTMFKRLAHGVLAFALGPTYLLAHAIDEFVADKRNCYLSSARFSGFGGGAKGASASSSSFRSSRRAAAPPPPAADAGNPFDQDYYSSPYDQDYWGGDSSSYGQDYYYGY